MSVTRFEHWPSLLSAFLESRRHTRFCYGVHDCCLFVADALKVITGVDFAADFRNRYSSAFGALRRMRESCAEASVDAVAARIFSAHGMRQISPALAQRGDVVAIPQRSDIVLGLIALNGWPVIAAERGWDISERARALKAWKV